jgi:hypothetical protein
LPKEYFSWENATNQVKIAKIEPSSSQERVLLFKPKAGVWGQFNFTFAEALYKSEGDSNEQVAITSDPGFHFIFSASEYERRFSLHLVSYRKRSKTRLHFKKHKRISIY